MGKQRIGSGIVAGHDRGRDKVGCGAGGDSSTRQVSLIGSSRTAIACKDRRSRGL
jgi:hypothetical protein